MYVGTKIIMFQVFQHQDITPQANISRDKTPVHEHRHHQIMPICHLKPFSFLVYELKQHFPLILCNKAKEILNTILHDLPLEVLLFQKFFRKMNIKDSLN